MTFDRHTMRRPVLCDECGVRPASLECVDCLYPVCDGCRDDHGMLHRAIEAQLRIRRCR